MINELIEQIGGRGRLVDIKSRIEMYGHGAGYTADEVELMARALLAVLDAQENSTIRKRKALLWLERQQLANPSMKEVRYAIEIIANRPAASLPDGWKLVPVNATRAMIDAAQSVEEDGYDHMHKAMLAAAPAPGGEK